ncbi:MAG TPA: WYL domain-containing protein, partial [Actinomycetes bacterium]|nr:WYL domain-containing protein [Actinomycetes bacterium]
RVDRVVSVRPTDELFERPANFDPAAHGELGGAELFAGGLECELDLGHNAEWVTDYFPILAAGRRPDGRLRVRLASHELSWLVRLVLRLAPDAEPVSPPELRGAVAEATRNALAAYAT